MAVSHHMCVEPGGNLTLYTVESTPADKEDILCVHRNHFLLRMLLTRNLVDLVDKHDSALRAFHIVVAGLQKPCQQ